MSRIQTAAIAATFCLFIACRQQQEEPVLQVPVAVTADTAIATFPIPRLDSGETALFFARHPVLLPFAASVEEYYRAGNGQYVWFNTAGVKEQAGFFLNLLRNLSTEGIQDTLPYSQRTDSLLQLIAAASYSYSGGDANTAELELLLTSQFFAYADRVYSGLNENTSRSLSWFIRRQHLTLSELLDALLERGPEAFVSALPLHQQYHLLKAAAQQLMQIQEAEWPALALPEGVRYLEAGDSAALVADIQYRLHLLGDMDSIAMPGVFDSLTTAAVQHFQQRHGLSADGQAGPFFFRELNISPATRLQQLYANMERYRWLGNSMQGSYLLANIPEFKLYVIENDTIAWDMNIIVGKASTGTIIFNDELEQVVFSPYWFVPASIIRNEIIPAMIKDNSYLDRNNMEVYNLQNRQTIDHAGWDWTKWRSTSFPYGIRQRPGGGNALGRVKFLFPNQYYIYFHDTPTHNLFARTQRTFSHGCIRLSEPARLAEYLLRNDRTWSRAAIDSAMYTSQSTTVPLAVPVPVFITYITCRTDSSGTLYWSSDVYGHDATLIKTLKERETAEIKL